MKWLLRYGTGIAIIVFNLPHIQPVQLTEDSDKQADTSAGEVRDV